MKVKRYFKILILNILLVFLIFIFFDFLCFFIVCALENKTMPHISSYYEQFQLIDFDTYYEKNKINLRDNLIANTKKKPILLFGCSYAYGYLLENEESLSYKLSRKSQRTVYNRALPSLGIQYFPYILEKYTNDKEIGQPEFIIFVLIDNHFFRLYRSTIGILEPILDVRYISSNEKIKEVKVRINFLYRFCLCRAIKNSIDEFLFQHRKTNKNFEFGLEHFIKAGEIIKKKYTKSKIVILKYNDMYDSEYLNTKKWQELEKEGFIVLDTKNLTSVDLSKSEYRAKDNMHPNEKAWDIIVPALVKELNL